MVVPQAAHWQRLKRLVLDSVSSPITRRVYNLGLDEFFESSTASYNGAAVTSKWKANWDAAPPSESSFRGPNPNRHLRRVREKKRPSFVGVGNRSATLGPGAIYMTLGTANARLDSHRVYGRLPHLAMGLQPKALSRSVWSIDPASIPVRTGPSPFAERL